MRHLRVLSTTTLLLIFGVFRVLAQSADCPAIVQTALSAADTACASTGRNQACYGNVQLTAQANPNATNFQFDKTGDLTDVSSIQSLHLAPLNLTDSTWGITLMNIQANLPDTLPGQNVTLLMFGDVELDNAVQPVVSLAMTTTRSANIRVRPTSHDTVLASLKSGSSVTANGRLADRSWIRIQLPDDSHSAGWVSASLLKTDGDMSTLTVVDAGAPILGPMQAFVFKSASGDAPCAEAPQNGILIQSPGHNRVNLTINGADVTLGSTAFFQAQPGGFMTISVIDGNVTVRANGVQQAIPAGTSTQIPLDANGLVSGSPQFPAAYDQTPLNALPVHNLPDAVTIAAPLPASQIQTAVAAAGGLPLPGKWRYVPTPEACGANYPAPTTDTITVENNGASILIGSANLPPPYTPYRYNQTAPGTYVLADLPRDYRQALGVLNIRETEVMTVLSPTSIRIDATDLFPASGCTASTTSTLTYIGP